MQIASISEIDEFAALIQRGIDSWVSAGKMLVKMRQQKFDIFLHIIAAHPWIELSALEMFCRIGEGKIHPRTLLLPPMLAEKVSRLPEPQQKEVLEKSPSEIKRMMLASNGRQNKGGPKLHQELGLSAKLPTAGFWKCTMDSGSLTFKKCEANERCIPVVLGIDNSFYIQVLDPKAGKQFNGAAKKHTPIIHDEMSDTEKAYAKFRAEME